ncbi:hypothetical protein [Micromonospora echinofusca]|uniref:DNRLRE domain-containing protein n=1 Tax=Micromonospora echinofusca TaxID=47858 RepID=A0ABS3VMY4_MICEH|nr:hypothetical protein [Micromonospora echinofusca]MBO4205866.1 hypothetical protein [Micromonospora echinofusca]
MGAGLVVITGPASAARQSTAARINWAYTDASQPHTSFFRSEDDRAPVGKSVDTAGQEHEFRSYVTYDLTSYRGQRIISAGFTAGESAVVNCAKPAPVELWVTDPVSETTTWQNPPVERTRVGTVVMGGERECPDRYHQFDAVSAVRAAVEAGQNQITLGLRIADGAESSGELGRRLSLSALTVVSNTPPAVPTELATFGTPCAGPDDAPWYGGSPRLSARFDDAEGSQERLRPTFAWWPVADPAARQEVTQTAQPPGVIRHQVPSDPPLAEGLWAWAARSQDSDAVSDWSPTCYFNVDRHVPAAPVVTSDDYPADNTPHGGPGIVGTFRIDPAGSTDVVRYRWSLSGVGMAEVPAPSMGAGTTIQVAPVTYGTSILEVQSYDRAGNPSRTTLYEFRVRDTAPEVTVEEGGVDLPSRVTMRPGVAGVTEYRYRIGDGPEVTVLAAPDGTASTEVTFRALGATDLVVASYTAAGLVGTRTVSLRVTDAPRVTSDRQEGSYHLGLVGEPTVFTLSPGRPGVVRYEYQVDDSLPFESVPADGTGAATVTWTPTEAWYYRMVVRSVGTDGTVSEVRYLNLQVRDTRPYVSSFVYDPPDSPQGGVGVSSVFWLYSEPGGVTEFVVRLNGGAEITVPASNGNYAEIELAPDRVGANVLTVRARYGDGTLSPAREWTFLVAG